MNVSIITCSNANNYGAILQTFALYYYIHALGHETAVLDYRPSYLEFKIKRWYYAHHDFIEWCKMFLRYNERSRLISKYKSIRGFADEYIRFSSQIYHSVHELRANTPIADIYIAGSDQIWNPSLPNGSDSSFFLDFGPHTTKRISYAASFAVDNLPESKKHDIKGWLDRFDGVSVREQSGKKICDELGIDAALVCDPVLLHSSDLWISIADYSRVPDTPYLLVYDFMKSKDIRLLSKKVASQKSLKIVSVSPYYLSYAYRNFCDCTPSQFLALIDKADCVVCNSLHGCIFSVLLRKDFFMVSREDGLNTRMRDFLARYGLLSRMNSNNDICVPIDYDCIYHKLDEDISFSKKWLYRQLN